MGQRKQGADEVWSQLKGFFWIQAKVLCQLWPTVLYRYVRPCLTYRKPWLRPLWHWSTNTVLNHILNEMKSFQATFSHWASILYSLCAYVSCVGLSLRSNGGGSVTLFQRCKTSQEEGWWTRCLRPWSTSCLLLGLNTWNCHPSVSQEHLPKSIALSPAHTRRWHNAKFIGTSSCNKLQLWHTNYLQG